MEAKSKDWYRDESGRIVCVLCKNKNRNVSFVDSSGISKHRKKNHAIATQILSDNIIETKNIKIQELTTKNIESQKNIEELTAKNKWLEDLTDKFIKCKKIQINSNVPKQLKNKIWFNAFGDSTEGLCYCCGITKLHITHFEAGHLISKAQGGELSEENLRPVCSACNKGTSYKNMKDYAQAVFLKTSILINNS